MRYHQLPHEELHDFVDFYKKRQVSVRPTAAPVLMSGNVRAARKERVQARCCGEEPEIGIHFPNGASGSLEATDIEGMIEGMAAKY